MWAKAWLGCAVGAGIYLSGHIRTNRDGFVPPQEGVGSLLIVCRRVVFLQGWISLGFANTIWPNAGCGKLICVFSMKPGMVLYESLT